MKPAIRASPIPNIKIAVSLAIAFSFEASMALGCRSRLESLGMPSLSSRRSHRVNGPAYPKRFTSRNKRSARHSRPEKKNSVVKGSLKNGEAKKEKSERQSHQRDSPRRFSSFTSAARHSRSHHLGNVGAHLTVFRTTCYVTPTNGQEKSECAKDGTMRDANASPNEAFLRNARL